MVAGSPARWCSSSAARWPGASPRSSRSGEVAELVVPTLPLPRRGHVVHLVQHCENYSGRGQLPKRRSLRTPPSTSRAICSVRSVHPSLAAVTNTDPQLRAALRADVELDRSFSAGRPEIMLKKRCRRFAHLSRRSTARRDSRSLPKSPPDREVRPSSRLAMGRPRAMAQARELAPAA
jgi:hypothetical protein